MSEQGILRAMERTGERLEDLTVRVVAALMNLTVWKLDQFGPWRRKSMQERWDEQIELNLSASHFGRGRETRMIGARMMHCPNNPRNGGDGFNIGDGTWRDRRWTP